MPLGPNECNIGSTTENGAEWDPIANRRFPTLDPLLCPVADSRLCRPDDGAAIADPAETFMSNGTDTPPSIYSLAVFFSEPRERHAETIDRGRREMT